MPAPAFFHLCQDHMSAWGYYNFDNDTAADFAERFRDTPNVEALRETLDPVTAAEEQIGALAASEALAAAEIVAAILGKPSRDFPADLLLVISKIDPAKGENLREAARQAVTAVRKQSELQRNWAATDDNNNWQAWQAELLDRLRNKTS